MIRTGYSLKTAIGKIDEVIGRLVEIGATTAPICDRNGTYGFVQWSKAAKAANLRPIYGVELPVTAERNGAKTIVDYCRFMARDSIKPLNDLIALATANGPFPSLTYHEALSGVGTYKIFGERARLEFLTKRDDVYVGLSPAISRGYYNSVNARNLNWCATDCNYYPRVDDAELYRITLGRHASSQTYPQHILSEQEWYDAIKHFDTADMAAQADINYVEILDNCTATLSVAEIFIPEKKKTLREMCIEGAQKLSCNLDNEVYAARLDRELTLIADKQFEDYFYIIADLVSYAKKHMIVGPGRGSSGGSLVCYLLGITTVDPIPYSLVFERFIDINRSDLPDIDLDFDDTKRHLVFEYAERKYGKDHVARLGTITMFKPQSAMNAVGAALKIPKFKIDKMMEGIIERSSGDARANNSLEDSLKETPGGKALLEEYPEVIIAGRMEGHPNNAGQHAAGIVVTKSPISDIVAIDGRTGATMCDKKDAEEYNLLKIDALGLTQLSIFGRVLELLGKKGRSIDRFLENIPLDDPFAFEIINQQKWAGIFQYNGSALQGLAKQFKTSDIEDFASITALARPGPLANGGANEWVKRRNGTHPVTYIHPLFEPYLKTSLGVTIYQEQIMEIGRHVGDMTWEDVTALRKAMSKSLGAEFFNKYGDSWKANAIKKGIPVHIANKAWDDMCTFGSWGFNRSHAVAYGLISYYCCYLKAHYPLEFAAATLDAEEKPERQLAYLRELKEEGIDYVAVDVEHSSDRWVPVRSGNQSYLVGPLGAIKGVGPKTVTEILLARKNKQPLRSGLVKKLNEAKTKIDNLYPIGARIKELHPDLNAIGIRSRVSKIKEIQEGIQIPVVIMAVVTRIAPRDENDLANVKKRGKAVSGPHWSLNMFLRDDSDEIFCKIGRYEYERLAKDIIDRGKVDKALYAIKGTVPKTFRMISVTNIKYLGDLE